MHSFHYHQGHLHCEQVNIAAIVAQTGSPLYIYSRYTLLEHYARLKTALAPIQAKIAFAVKSCSNIAILNLMAREGACFDIVSAGELYRVEQAGGDTTRCCYAGVGKTEDEIRYALKKSIYCLNVESEAEMWEINRIAQSMGTVAPVAVRVNPNVVASTHKYIATGKAENKFGVDFEKIEDLYALATEQMPHLYLRGLQMHIGSQLTDAKPFAEAVARVAPLAARLKQRFGIESFSIGGGIGIVYAEALESGNADWWTPSNQQLTFDAFAQAVIPALKDLGLQIIVEPGRVIVGNAGILITTCLYEKVGAVKTFKIVDSGMNDLIRPALYEGHHQILPVQESLLANQVEADVVGPICESGDFFAQNRLVADVKQGDLLAVLSAGAYGASMSSNYNSRPLLPEILVDGASWHTIRPRQSWQDMIKGEAIVD